LVWFDRSGKRLGTVAEPGTYSNLALSPDEQRLAISRVDPQVGSRDIWILELNRGGERLFTFDRGDDMNPVWDPRGARIAFSSTRTGQRGLYVKDATGVGEDQMLLESGSVADWSRDGRYILEAGSILPLFGDRKPVDLPDGTANPRASPDGRWLAYQSNERGRLEIYVRSFQDVLAGRSGGKWQVSSAGGIYPEWGRDGRELFYVAPDNTLMSVPVKASGNAFQAEPPTPLFPLRLEAVNRRTHYQPAMNGQRFLVAQVLEQDASNPITVMVNWTATPKE
jgi:Tol biopolymer transport system component